MTSKGKQMRKFSTFKEATQKIVIKKPWGVEIKSYKAGDPIPAGVEFKIFNATDTDKIEAYADGLDESADYQKERFLEPECLNESKYYIKRTKDGTKNLYFGTVAGLPLWGGKREAFTFDDEEKAEKYKRKYEYLFDRENEVKVVKESLSSKTHKFKPEELKVGKRVIDKVGGKEIRGKITVNHHDLYKDNPYTQDKKGSTVVTVVTDSGRSYDVDANDNGGEFILESQKAIKEAYLLVDIDTNNKPVYFHWGKYTGIDWWDDKKMASRFSTKEQAERWIEKMRQEGAIIKDMKIVQESRIAKGYENLNADERAKHLLSHPSSKYMSDLKSENITERAIRKAVKEMLAQPDKRDPQFITDVNEEGEAPAIANTTAEVANPDLPLKLKESVGQKLNITLVRKPQNMKEVESDIRKGHGDRVKAVVDKSYKLTENEYDKFVYNFMVHTTYLSGEGGVDSDGTVHVIEITAPGKKTIYVNPEGYDYARYVGW